MKTANKGIDIYYNIGEAEKAFEKEEYCDFLKYTRIPKEVYYIYRSKEAIKQWPRHYKLLKSK